MQGNKRKDMAVHIRALLTWQSSCSFKPEGRVISGSGMRCAPLKAVQASCGIAPVPDPDLNPQSRCN